MLSFVPYNNFFSIFIQDVPLNRHVDVPLFMYNAPIWGSYNVSILGGLLSTNISWGFFWGVL